MVAQGLAQLRIGSKSLSGFSFKQVGFWLILPLSFGSSPPLSRLFRPYSSPSTSLPDCAPNSFRWVSMNLYVMIHFWLSACADLVKNRLKYKYLLLLVVLSWCEGRLSLGRDLALVELGRRQIWHILHMLWEQFAIEEEFSSNFWPTLLWSQKNGEKVLRTQKIGFYSPKFDKFFSI